MKLEGKLIVGNKTLKVATCNVPEGEGVFRDRLEACLIGLCKELDIPVPLWMNKNTSEFVRFRHTAFHHEQFMEPVKFDKMDIRLESQPED